MKTNSPLVSIIVVAFQSERFILDVLESIKNQLWENIELVVTDDASTDNTVALCSEWINKNSSRFASARFITHNQNSGILANCDRGFKATTGEWVKFIGADDKLLENCISDNMEIVNNNPEISFIISDLIEIDEFGDIIKVGPKNIGLEYFMKNTSNKERLLKAYARWPAFLNTPTFFYKRNILHNTFYNKSELRIYEDISSIFNIIKNDAKIFYLQKTTVKYRIHNKAVSRNIKHERRREQEAYLVYKNYRKQYLSAFNPIDVSVFYEIWLRFKFKGVKGYKGISVLEKLSLFYWYLAIQGIKRK